MNERVRAVLVTPHDELLAIRRDRPGTPSYCVLPGGQVEPTDRSLEDALMREIREELAGEPAIHSLTSVAAISGPDDRCLPSAEPRTRPLADGFVD